MSQQQQNQNHPVADHYNKITYQWKQSNRSLSPIHNLKCLQNFIKTCLLKIYIPDNKTTVKLLDLCGGKGGDLTKYQHFKQITSVTLVDISKSSIDAAVAKYQSLQDLYCSFEAYLMDAWADQEFFKTQKFDVVVCHFAMHYACRDPQTLQQALANVGQCLTTNGYFIFTAPNPQRIQEFKNNSICQVKFNVHQSHQSNTTDNTIDNNQVNTTVNTPVNTTNAYNAYSFSLADSVQDCVEYMLPAVATLSSYAEKADLYLDTHQSFKDFLLWCVNRFPDLAQRMKCIDNQKKPLFSLKEEQVSNLYDVYVFRKKQNK